MCNHQAGVPLRGPALGRAPTLTLEKSLKVLCSSVFGVASVRWALVPISVEGHILLIKLPDINKLIKMLQHIYIENVHSVIKAKISTK